MIIVSINAVPYGSTAKIMVGIANTCTFDGIENIVCAGYSYHPMREMPNNYIHIGNWFDKSIHIMLEKITGCSGCFSYIETRHFLKKIEKINPDIIHLHNIHGAFINIPLVFKYIKSHNKRVIWTLHDCWAFTGRCPHFIITKCDKWKTGCHHCLFPAKKYPQSYVDNTRNMWKLKREMFTSIKKMIIVTPSQWLAGLVKESFLKDYPLKVINNGIDLSIFKPTESDFRKKKKIGDKYILLGVAFGWGTHKGLDIFIDLARRLDPNLFQIVLVGTDNRIDKLLPANIISIHRTQDQRQLAEIYSSADLFVNPTREEVLGLVNIESLACGTPVVTFRTGGSPECLDETCGSVVECDDIDTLEKEIKRILINRVYSPDDCVKYAKKFEEKKLFNEYINLYKTI